jgi:hypothetical protein
MTPPRSPLRRIATLTAFVVVALALAGCTKKLTSVDPAFTAPEGQTAPDARLTLYTDQSVTLETWADLVPDGADPTDTLLTTEAVAFAPGTLHGLILDGTPASGYQVLRREGNGGYAPLKDYVLSPVARFLESQWEAYTFADANPSGFDPPTYVGRGVVAGEVTRNSPLTNVAELGRQPIAELTYTGDPAPRDSNITMSWNPVAGAAGYWMQIYVFLGDADAAIHAAQPAPFVASQTRNYFMGYVAAPATSYKLGENGALVLTRRTLLSGVAYQVRVSAVDDQGQLIGFSYGDWKYLQGVGTYRRFRAGAATVSPTRPGRH